MKQIYISTIDQNTIVIPSKEKQCDSISPNKQ